MRRNVMKINKEALEQVTGGGRIPSYLTVLENVLCDDCNDNDNLYIQDYWEKNVAYISCRRCGEGFYWDYKINDYGDIPFPH